MIQDVRDIRNNNVEDILSAVRFHDNITRREIAEMCNLSFPTVSKLCNELIELGILSETDIPTSRIGRTPKGLVFNYNRFYSVGVDLQLQGYMGFAILDLRSQVVLEEDYDITHLENLDEILSFAAAVFTEKKSELGLEDECICGLGISVSAIYDKVKHKLVNSAIPMFEDQKIKAIAARYFDCPIYVDNESNLCALAVSSRDKDLQNAVYLHISEGVGVGIIAEGHLLRGKNGYAAEIAHIPIGDPSIKCPTCPGYGCVEPELHIAGLVRSLPDRSHSGRNLREQWKVFVDYIKGSNGKEVARQKGVLLGRLSSILVNLFDPEVLYIGGHIAEVYSALEPYFLDELRKRCPLWDVHPGVNVVCDLDSSLTHYVGIGETIYAKWNPLEANGVHSAPKETDLNSR